MADITQVGIPETAQQNLRAMFAQRQQLEQQIQAYIQGLRDSLNVTGEGWSIQLETMTFVKQPMNGKVEADVLGATASNSERE